MEEQERIVRSNEFMAFFGDGTRIAEILDHVAERLEGASQEDYEWACDRFKKVTGGSLPDELLIRRVVRLQTDLGKRIDEAFRLMKVVKGNVIDVHEWVGNTKHNDDWNLKRESAQKSTPRYKYMEYLRENFKPGVFKTGESEGRKYISPNL